MDRRQQQELMKLPGVAELVEITYRRGFCQGAHWSVEAAMDAQPVQELQQWCQALENWRYLLIDIERGAVLRGAKGWSCPPEPWQFSKANKAGS